jgi:hypothetical protein
MSTEAMKQALEALESVLCDPDGNVCWHGSYADRDIIGDALAVFRTAIEEAEKQEPVKRWPFVETPEQFSNRLFEAIREFGSILPAVRNVLIENPPLYTTPPAAPVQELGWNWFDAPVKTQWGHDMVVADLAIDKDHTVSIYCEKDQTAKVEAMFTPPAATVQEPDLIARLKNPEDHYEFTDPKKANAVLMSLCQEAADALAVQHEPDNEPHVSLASVQSAEERSSVERVEPVAHDYQIRYDRGCYKCRSHYCPGNCVATTPPAAPVQEPVATVVSENKPVTMSWWHEPALPVGTKLYTTPPNVATPLAAQREWRGLTDEEIYGEGGKHEKFAKNGNEWFDRGSFARAIEQHLKEKNHHE